MSDMLVAAIAAQCYSYFGAQDFLISKMCSDNVLGIDTAHLCYSVENILQCYVTMTASFLSICIGACR